MKYHAMGEEPKLWLLIVAFSEHYRLVKRAIQTLIAAGYLHEQQAKHLKPLREDLTHLRNFLIDSDREAEQTELGMRDEDDHTEIIVTEGEVLESVETLGFFSIFYRYIIQNAENYGLDAADSLVALQQTEITKSFSKPSFLISRTLY